MPNITETILLAEDEPLVRAMLVAVLRSLGYNVLEAANGVEALQAAQEHVGEIQLLLSDVAMPQMNGIELARRLRDIFPGIRILLMSGYTDEENLRQVLPDPSIGFIPKPFSPQELADRVRQMLSA